MAAAGLITAAHPGPHLRRFRRGTRPITVTRRNGRPATRIGVRPRAARHDLRTATYVALAAPGWAPDHTLWTVLDQWAPAHRD